MEREGFDVPLLIGGATTSRVHTAVKISPNYERGQAIYVLDASRAVGVVSNAPVRDASAPIYVGEIRAEYVKVREAHVAQRGRQARASRSQRRAPTASRSTGQATRRRSRRFLGTRAFADYDLAELVPVHRLDAVLPDLGAGRALSRDPRGRQGRRRGARSCSPTRRRCCKRIVAEKWLTARAASSASGRPTAIGDDIELYTDETREHARSRCCTRCASRSRATASRDRANTALADFVAPKETGLADYVGGFAVTAGIGEEEALKRASRRHDDYAASSSRRSPTAWPKPSPSACTSACARSSGATRADEKLSNDELIAEKYRGIRPAPGYPAQPDHTEKATLWTAPGRREGAPASS